MWRAITVPPLALDGEGRSRHGEGGSPASKGMVFLVEIQLPAGFPLVQICGGFTMPAPGSGLTTIGGRPVGRCWLGWPLLTAITSLTDPDP